MNFTDLDSRGGVWRPASPASEHALRHLVLESPIDLPDAYLHFLRYSNGGEGSLGRVPGWAAFWPAEAVLDLNREYKVSSTIPGLYGFGSNGAGELLVFDLRAAPAWRIAMIPFIPMTLDHLVEIAGSFEELLGTLGRISGRIA